MHFLQDFKPTTRASTLVRSPSGNLILWACTRSQPKPHAMLYIQDQQRSHWLLPWTPLANPSSPPTNRSWPEIFLNLSCKTNIFKNSFFPSATTQCTHHYMYTQGEIYTLLMKYTFPRLGCLANTLVLSDIIYFRTEQKLPWLTMHECACGTLCGVYTMSGYLST